eukprot:5629343-Pleurochrysis_carterae.AAC.1
MSGAKRRIRDGCPNTARLTQTASIASSRKHFPNAIHDRPQILRLPAGRLPMQSPSTPTTTRQRQLTYTLPCLLHRPLPLTTTILPCTQSTSRKEAVRPRGNSISTKLCPSTFSAGSGPTACDLRQRRSSLAPRGAAAKCTGSPKAGNGFRRAGMAQR